MRSLIVENACVGAGTVLDAETARISMLSGAKYIVSPFFDEDTMRICNRYSIPCLPGAMTIHDIVEDWFAAGAGESRAKQFIQKAENFRQNAKS